MEDCVTDAARRRQYLAAGFWDDSTLVGRVSEISRRRPDDVAVVDAAGERRHTYAQLQRDGLVLASRLREIGVGRGDVVSVQLPNWYETVVAALAIQTLGAVINPLLPNYRSKELVYVFQTAMPKAIFTPAVYRGFDHRTLVSDVCQAVAQQVTHIVVGEGAASGDSTLEEILSGPDPTDDFTADPPPAANVSELIFTSGTEANPKAIMHTEQTANFSVRVAREYLRVTDDDVVWMPSPIGHSTGFNYGVRFALYHGLKLVLQDRWDAALAAELIEREGCSYTLAATTFLQDLTEEAGRSGRRLETFQRFGCGGAPVPPGLVEAADKQGIRVLRLYGSTEVLVATWNGPDATLEQRKHTDGSALPHVEVTTRDDEGRPCPPGVSGEIYVRGPNTCVGFFRDPERTSSTFLEDGWVRSGDLATIDADGNLTVVGRKKEIIIRGGMNITPREVEDMLLQFPEVHRAAVVGLPDERLGERACACLVLREGATLSFASMVERLRASGIADYKLPERLELLAELPTTPSGKVQKHEIVRVLLERNPRGRWDRGA
jgi:acyl-coenzyme A synthetase/AMP-(fatty) acid ligase